MKNIPKEIYLNLGISKREIDIKKDDIDFEELNGISWSTDKIHEQDLKFVLDDVSICPHPFEDVTRDLITEIAHCNKCERDLD